MLQGHPKNTRKSSLVAPFLEACNNLFRICLKYAPVKWGSMIDLRDVHSVTEFQRNLKDYVGQLRAKKTPLVLTVNGRAELVVQNAESYQALLDRLERAETLAAIRQGIEEFKRGEGIPLEKAAQKLRRKHGFSR